MKDLLKILKIVGFYNKAEFIEIFGFDSHTKVPFNIFSLIVFQNTNRGNIEEEFLTKKLQRFKGDKNLKWGIVRRLLDLDVALKLFEKLQKNKEYKVKEKLSVGDLRLLKEQYVPPDIYNEKQIQLNKILKNNFYNGSYIFEFFDETKKFVKFLLDNPKVLNDFSEKVSKIIPIHISALTDKLGNIIFQLPINIFKVHMESIKGQRGINFQFKGFKIKFSSKYNYDFKDLLIRIYEKFDNVILRQKLIEVNSDEINITLDDSCGTIFEIIDKRNGILLFRRKVNIIKHVNFNMHIVEPQERIFKIGEEIIKIKVETLTEGFISKKEKGFEDWIRDRIYEDELKFLEKRKYFVQYCKTKEDLRLSKEERHKKALDDIRFLIKKYGKKGVYLWDPYLNAIDIKKTLYYCPYAYVPLRAITALQSTQKKLKEVLKQEMIDEFQKDNKKYLFLNLEVRAKIGNNGYDFHDRFIIFPLEKPMVWSLGTSINSFGKCHHILQEVKHAQHILDAFNNLWNELEKEECIVWKI